MIRDRVRKDMAGKLLALMEGKYDFGAVEEDVQQIYLADADEILSIPEIATGIELCEALQKGELAFVDLTKLKEGLSH